MNPGDVKEYIQWLFDFKKSFRDGQPPPGYEYLCPEEVILRYGRPFEYKADMNGFKKSKAKQCYSNAFNFMVDNMIHNGEKLYYCEGYASSEKCSWLPLEHAWCVNEKGEVIDPTWSDEGGGMAYWGVAFTQEFSQEQILKQKRYSFIFNWVERLPLLKKGAIQESDIALKGVKPLSGQEAENRREYKYKGYWIKPIYKRKWAVYREGTLHPWRMWENFNSAEECELSIRHILREGRY